MNSMKKVSAIFIQWIIFSTLFPHICSHTGHGDAVAVEAFYTQCGTTATCIGLMSEISKLEVCRTSECPATLIIMPPMSEYDTDQSIHFHLRLNTNEYGYMSIGLTLKSRMDEMLVLECLVDVGMNVYSFISWNPATPNNPTSSNPFSPPERIYGAYLNKTKDETNLAVLEEDLPAPPKGINITTLDREDGVVFCDFYFPKKFSIAVPSTSQSIAFDLESQKYSVGIAVGSIDDEGSCAYVKSSSKLTLCKHSAVGSRRFKLMEIQDPTPEEHAILSELHAFLMTLAYLTLMPIATIIARYFKETWTTHTICHKRVWLPIHFILLYAALICTIVAYIIQAIEHDTAFPDGIHAEGGPAHALIGLSSMVLLLSQTIFPWVIPTSYYNLKKVYSVIHAVVGSICYGLGILNIILTPILMPEAASCEVIFITFIWMGCHFCIYWLLTTLLVIKDHEMEDNDSKFRALLSYPMRLQTSDDAAGKSKRKLFLAIFVVLSLLMTSMMSYQVFRGNGSCKIYMKSENVESDFLSTTQRAHARW